MIKNGKYFVSARGDDSNFKELFARLAAAGAGRPVDDEGFPEGPWTPDLLAAAISEMTANQGGVDLRTVQLWFQNNDKGISSENIRWLARIFGCDDPEAASELQAILSAAQARLAAERRENKRCSGNTNVRDGLDTDAVASAQPVSRMSTPIRGVNLARRSEAIFSRGSLLDLPATVFAGAVALGFLSYLTGIHSILYERADGVTKQVGFIWAPNWTVLFMVFMPLFFAFTIELVLFWRHHGRAALSGEGDRVKSESAWLGAIETSSYTFWAVFLICLGFAGLFQWIGVRLMPLMNGGGNFAIDWGSFAIVEPDVISVPIAVVFTGLAYLYMCLTFYLLFVGLILLHTVVYDLGAASDVAPGQSHSGPKTETDSLAIKVMRSIFRCTICGLMIAICMKLQSIYLTSNGSNVLAWLASDMAFVFSGMSDVTLDISYSMPTHYTSLLVALLSCVPFLYGFYRLGTGSRHYERYIRMTIVIVFVVMSYLAIGAFPGFSYVLVAGATAGVVGLFDPEFGFRKVHHIGGKRVS